MIVLLEFLEILDRGVILYVFLSYDRSCPRVIDSLLNTLNFLLYGPLPNILHKGLFTLLVNRFMIIQHIFSNVFDPKASFQHSKPFIDPQMIPVQLLLDLDEVYLTPI